MSARVAYIETYFTGSHARIGELLRRQSKHDIEIFPLGPQHWRWTALTTHYAIADSIARSGSSPPDLMIVSGPIQLAGLLALLPSRWAEIPRAVYLHESQWTYPAAPYDPRPYLVSHLDSVRLADRLWFNSKYHRDTFQTAALENPSLRVRSLARRVLADHWHKSSVLYPPVNVDQRLARSKRPAGPTPRVCWVARWKAEKRPDLFVEAMERLRRLHPTFDVAVFPGGSRRALPRDPLYARIDGLNGLERPPATRREYECELAACDVLISTAEHEFFGVAAIEAAMLGAIPLMPAELAYPETLPSSPCYRPGVVDDLVRSLKSILERRWLGPAPWQQHGLRFALERTVPAYDAAIDDALARR